MSKRYHVQADWDPDAKVWVSTSNIPGLHVEAPTLPEFIELAQVLAPEMLSDNLGLEGAIPIDFRATETLELHK